MLFVVVVVALAVCIRAHNWVNSASRSPKDNTVVPALPSATGSAHVQVIAGQTFQVEWQQGHTHNNYFVLTKKDAWEKLKTHDEKTMNAYLEAAGANKATPAGKWQKFHRTAGATAVNMHGGVMNYFKSQVAATSANYITRSDVFLNNFKGLNTNPATKIYQWIYPDECKANDRRTFHKSADHPWIIGMWRFFICKHEPARPDVALFNVPTGTAPGEYMLHYRWRGYSDVIDIEVVAGTKAVAKPYGERPDPANLPPPVFQRIPHCEFKNAVATHRCMRIVSDDSSCVKRCGRLSYLQCNGVNVVHAVNRRNTGFDQVNVPFDDDATMPICARSAVLKGLTDEDVYNQRTKVCYGLAAGSNPGFGAYYLTADPDDPAFYSTCHVRVPPVIRTGPAPMPEAPPTGVMPFEEFTFGRYCLTGCSWGYRNRRNDVALNYPLRTARCRDCRSAGTAAYMNYKWEQPTSTYTAPRVKVFAAKKRYDGSGNVYSLGEPCPKVNNRPQACLERISQFGSGTVQIDTLLADTVELIRRKHTRCSNHFVTRFNQTDRTHGIVISAFCLRKEPACCLNTKTKGSGSLNIYEIDSAWRDAFQ